MLNKWPRKPKAIKGKIWIKVITGYPDGSYEHSWESIPKIKFKMGRK